MRAVKSPPAMRPEKSTMTAQAGDAVRQPCGGERGQNQRDQRRAEEIAAQNVQGGGALFRTE